MGKPNADMEVEIRDGVIWSCGPYVMCGHWGEPPIEGCYNTGDSE